MKVCSQPGCHELADQGSRCKRHRPEGGAWKPHAKTAAARGYGTAHRRWREAVLKRDPLCVDCRARGKATPATDADHIDGNQFNRLLENGRGLCRKCHMRRTHGREARQRRAGVGVRDAGAAWGFE